MDKIIITGTVFNLLKTDNIMDPSFWIEKDGGIVGDIYYGRKGYQEAKEVFDLLEEQKAED